MIRPPEADPSTFHRSSHAWKIGDTTGDLPENQEHRRAGLTECQMRLLIIPIAAALLYFYGRAVTELSLVLWRTSLSAALSVAFIGVSAPFLAYLAFWLIMKK